MQAGRVAVLNVDGHHRIMGGKNDSSNFCEIFFTLNNTMGIIAVFSQKFNNNKIKFLFVETITEQ